MRKLSEIKTEGNLKVLVFGNSGVGKTCFAADFPAPILYFDFDGKVDSAASFYAGKKDLSQIDVIELAAGFHPDSIVEMDKHLKNDISKYKTIIVDSLTTYSNAVLRHIVKTNPGIKRPVYAQGGGTSREDYGILLREFAKRIPGLLALPCNVVMLGHIDTERDELTGEVRKLTRMDGSFNKDLNIYFKEVWRIYADGKGVRWAQTQSDSNYDCRSQIRGLPNPLKLEYAELEKYLKQ